MKKSNRQAIIKRIIQENEIETQDDLIQCLKAEGVQATQATISRDVRELGIVKGHTESGTVKYVLIDQGQNNTRERLQEVIEESVEKVSQVQFMVVIQTYLGAANILAAIIDDLEMPEVAGTLAGANTLSIITHSNEEAKIINDFILTYLK